MITIAMRLFLKVYDFVSGKDFSSINSGCGKSGDLLSFHALQPAHYPIPATTSYQYKFVKFHEPKKWLFILYQIIENFFCSYRYNDRHFLLAGRGERGFFA